MINIPGVRRGSSPIDRRGRVSPAIHRGTTVGTNTLLRQFVWVVGYLRYLLLSLFPRFQILERSM